MYLKEEKEECALFMLSIFFLEFLRVVLYWLVFSFPTECFEKKKEKEKV